MTRDSQAVIEKVSVRAFTVPTEQPESDGTLEWHATTLVWVSVRAGGRTGCGYSYADTATARLIHDRLGPALHGHDALEITACFDLLVHAVRNLGRTGIAAMAISAIDNALWDLKGRLLDCAVATLLGGARARVPAYGSGGFTSYTLEELRRQLSGWAQQGFTRVKMKVGRQPELDPGRVAAARSAIGPATELFVDANGAYSRKLALAMAERFGALGVVWFEEPVSSDDLEGLAQLRERTPAGLEVSAGEYGYTSDYFRRMCAAQAVDVLQADATRCGGITGFMRAAAIADAFLLPFSSHCAPSLHVHPCCAAPRVRHLEYFHDHVRLEQLLLEGAVQAHEGHVAPDLTRPGFGLALKEREAARFEA